MLIFQFSRTLERRGGPGDPFRRYFGLRREGWPGFGRRYFGRRFGALESQETFRAYWQKGSQGHGFLSDEETAEAFGCASIYPYHRGIAGFETAFSKNGRDPEALTQIGGVVAVGNGFAPRHLRLFGAACPKGRVPGGKRHLTDQRSHQNGQRVATGYCSQIPVRTTPGRSTRSVIVARRKRAPRRGLALPVRLSL